MDARAQPVGRHRTATVVAAAVLVLAVLVVVMHLDSARDHRRWVDGCRARGGQVVSEARVSSNPLVVGTTDPVFHCTAGSG